MIDNMCCVKYCVRCVTEMNITYHLKPFLKLVNNLTVNKFIGQVEIKLSHNNINLINKN